jgi:ketosteroid isomerase-like protein
MISMEFAENFAQQWVRAWNLHDLDKILTHYADTCELTSPLIVTVLNEPLGTVKGKERIRSYWEKALDRVPDLSFELLEVLISVNSITIYYRSVFGRLAAEVMFLDKNMKVIRAVAHYNQML